MNSKEFNYIVNTKLWRWPGDMGWHFVTIDKKISEVIRKKYTKGFVKIKAKVGNTEWNTSPFPHLETGVYLLSIKKSVRKKEELMEGDMIKVKFSLV